jgi:hypothetical protein
MEREKAVKVPHVQGKRSESIDELMDEWRGEGLRGKEKF